MILDEAVDGGLKVDHRVEHAVRAQVRWTERNETPATTAIAQLIQWVASPGGSPSVRATTRSTKPGGQGGSPG